jgi:hypothetical protein
MRHLLPVLLLVARIPSPATAADTKITLYDPVIVQADGKDIHLLTEGTISGTLTHRGKPAGDLTITLDTKGMMTVKGLEKLGVKGKIPYVAHGASNGLKSKFPCILYTIASNLPDGKTRAPVNLSFTTAKVDDDQKDAKKIRISTSTVNIQRGNDAFIFNFDGTWFPTLLLVAPEAAEAPEKKTTGKK